jgi:hypothetical protein
MSGLPSNQAAFVQEVPLNVVAPPSTPTATQDWADAQDTCSLTLPPALNPEMAESAATAVLQVAPLNVEASPMLSIAAQKLTEGHDTVVGPPA